jgi:hypothetical protein
MSTVIPALGTTLSINKATTVYTEISEILSIETTSEVGSADTTNLSSEIKTSRPTLLDPGEVSYEINYDPNDADHIYVRDLMSAPAIKSWRITFPTTPATTATFDGYLTGFDESAGGPEDNLTASIKIKRNSVVTYATAAE